jgi:predicted lysophospholipase L1 biosynthesis ABC-type transport system permease subunit
MPRYRWKLIAERARLRGRYGALAYRRIVAAASPAFRDVEWRESSNGFVFVFRPGFLDDAPQMFVAPLKGPATPEARARFQHDLVERFPNVSVIDFHEVLETIRDVMSKVTLAITVVGALVLFSGALILVGAVAMTKFQRVYEAAVFKTLGANTRTIARMLLIEYSVLGSLAGLIGSLGAVVLTWGVSRYALEIPWRVFAGEHVAGGVLTGAPCRHRRPLEPRRAEEQAARDAPRGIATDSRSGVSPPIVLKSRGRTGGGQAARGDLR